MQVMQIQEQRPANAADQDWMSAAVAAILDSLAAILSISNENEHFLELLPESLSFCERLLNSPHPIVKVGPFRNAGIP